MKYAALAAIMFAVPVLALPVEGPEAQNIVQAGEVIGSRAFIQPTLGFELLIRHDGGIYLCNVSQQTKYGYNGAPNVDYMAVNACLSQAVD